MPAPNLKITFRQLWKSKLYSSINVIGLAAGITCMLLAILYWKDERSFDTFHENNPNLYRITTTLVENKGAGKQTIGGTGQVQGPAFKSQVPEVKDYVRVLGGDVPGDVMANGKSLQLKLLFADDHFFNLFSFPLLHGNPQTVLKDIHSAVITESTALKFFNSIDVIGKPIQMDADPSAKRLAEPLIITGVVKDPPANSSIQFDILFSFQFMQLSFDDNNWLNAYLGTFVLLSPNADIKAVAAKFDQVYASQAGQQRTANIKSYGYDPQVSYGLQRMTDIHLNPLSEKNSNAEGGIINGSNPVFSWLFLGIAGFILLMAAINFINISIAASLKRAKEVGVRKIAGGSKIQIIWQFLSESAILCLLAFLLAIIGTRFSLPLFNRLTDKQILFSQSLDAGLLFYFALLLGMIILLAGLYPASVLSNFIPAEVLYNKQRLSGRNAFGRALVVIQFSLAIFLLMATLVYYRQMDYVRTKDLGYNPQLVIRTSLVGDRDYAQIRSFLQHEISSEPAIAAISFTDNGNNAVRNTKINDRYVGAVHRQADEHYLPLLEIPLKAGRNFSAAFPTDKTQSVIVNETFVKAAGLENPIGARVFTDEPFNGGAKTIIGVVKDFHTGSLRERIPPLMLFMGDWTDGGILVKFEKSKQKEAMTAWEKAFRQAMPNLQYQVHFLDELNAREYVQEAHWQQVIRVAALLSIMICALGLFGLAHLSTRRRVKEIGVRKVLGASVRQIVALLAADFLKLVMVAFVVAAPIAWFVMNRWLQDFAYRTTMGAGVFLLAGLLALTVAFIAVSAQSVMAAVANPVSSLRSE
ncbi:MAG: ABC transporter permease [Bacteroidota bacterium]|nr:ABC transporter permease [Bacteroidota bacterium]